MKIELPFSVQEGKSSAEQNSRETLINLYTEMETSGRRQLIRKQRPGLNQVYAITGEKRAIEKLKSTHYLVIGDTFYSFDGTTLTNLGTIGTSTGRCTIIFDDNDNAAISDGTNGYYWDGSTIAAISHSTDIGQFTYQGGFGIFPQPDSGTFWVTATNDFSTIDALDFATAESAPDPIVRAFVDHNELWLFGETTVEIWQLSGSADFPFIPLSSAQIERGCAAAFSVGKEDNTLFWLGNDLVVYRAEGYRPQRISTHAIERAIEDVPEADRANAEAVMYTVNGAKFYTLRFPSHLTIQYNMATGLWNLCKTYTYEDWRIIGSAGRMADYVLTDGGICSLDSSINTDEGGIMQRQAISAPLWAGGRRVSLREYFLDLEVGRAGIGVTDPQIMLRVARDGETFGNERWRSVGNTGKYRTRVMWRNLGMGRRITLEFTVTDDFSIKIMGGDGHATALGN